MKNKYCCQRCGIDYTDIDPMKIDVLMIISFNFSKEGTVYQPSYNICNGCMGGLVYLIHEYIELRTK